METMFTKGSMISFNGVRGEVISITETYRKNVLVVKIHSMHRVPKWLYRKIKDVTTIGIFELPGGVLRYMTVIEPD